MQKKNMEDFVPESVNPMENDEVIEEKQNPESNNGNGSINHIISNLVTPKSDGDDEENKSKQAEEETTNGGEDKRNEEKSGGLFGHIISNLVTPSSPKPGNVEAFDGANESGLRSREEVGGGGQGGGEKTEDGGGIIDDTVSQLPTSLPDDAAPTTDEATILIHIVQD